MRSDLLLACIMGPLLAVFLLKGRARRLLAAIFGGMLIAYFAGSISGFLAGLLSYDAMAAVLYISPAVEEGLKLILFLLFLFVCQLEDAELPDIAVGVGVGFAMMESIALQHASGDVWAMRLFARAFCSALIHVACALMLILAVRMVRRMALETLSGILGIYAVTVTVHALYNLMVSAGGAGEVAGYCLPALLIGAWKLWPAIRKSYGR